MKVGEALAAYRTERKMIVQERRELYKRRESLEKRMNAAEGGRERYADEAATLELSIDNVNARFEENLKVLDQLTEQEAAVWNAEVSRQQADVMEDYAVEMGKILEVAHRIAKGAIVPASDEKSCWITALRCTRPPRVWGPWPRCRKSERNMIPYGMMRKKKSRSMILRVKRITRRPT